MKILFLVISFFSTICLNAQNQYSKSDDVNRIALNVFIPEQAMQLSDINSKNLKNKVNQIVAKYGLSGTNETARFIVVPVINIIDKDVAPTAVPMHAIKIEVTLYMGDGLDGTKFTSNTITTKGIGQSDIKAYDDAINKININDPSWSKFIEDGKKRVIEFYNSKCDFIIKNAQTLASQNKYDESIYNLTLVPEVCKECYDKCMDEIVKTYNLKKERECQLDIANSKSMMALNQFDSAAYFLRGILPGLSCYSESQILLRKINDHRCAVYIAKAKGAWAVKDLETTTNSLQEIPSDSKCYSESLELIKEVKVWIKEKEKRDWDFKLKEQKDQVELQKESIKAARDIGVAYGNHQPKTITSYNIRGWW